MNRIDESFAPDDLMDLPIVELAEILNKRRNYLKKMREGYLSVSEIKRQERMVEAARIALWSRRDDVIKYFVRLSLDELREREL